MTAYTREMGVLVMRIFGLLFLVICCSGSVVADARVEFFHAATAGKNASIVKVGLMRQDYIAEGDSVQVVVSAARLTGESIPGELSFTLSRQTPFVFVRADSVLNHFDVKPGEYVHLDVWIRPLGFSPGEVDLEPCDIRCAAVVTHLMIDTESPDGDVRQMESEFRRCSDGGSAVGFFNRSSNVENENVLLLINPEDYSQQIRVSRDPNYNDADQIALLRLPANVSLMLSARMLESTDTNHVFKAMEPGVRNSSLSISSTGSGKVLCANWIKNGGVFHALRGAIPDGFNSVHLFMAFDDLDNQPLINIFNLEEHSSAPRPEDVSISAFDERGRFLPGSAILRTSELANGDKVLVTLDDLRHGNSDKSIVSDFGSALSGRIRLQFNAAAPISVQYLLASRSGAVRDMTLSYTLDDENPRLIPFFNKADNRDQESLLYFHNPQTIPVQVVISDVHGDVETSFAMRTLAPGTSTLLSSSELESGMSGTGQDLPRSSSNRQLKIVSLSNVPIEVMNLVLNASGVWRNLTLDEGVVQREDHPTMRY